MQVSERSTASELVSAARERLAGQAVERLGDWAHSRKLLGFGRAPRIVPVGAAWHVGVLLLTDDGVLATGEILRAREEAIRGFVAESQRQRAAVAAAAFRGGFAEGETVHLGAVPIDLAAVDAGGESGPLSVAGDGTVLVQWSAAGATRPLAGYLDEQISLRPSSP